MDRLITMKEHLQQPLSRRGSTRSQKGRYQSISSLKQAVLFQALPHVGLLVTAVLYIITSAVVFNYFEAVGDGSYNETTAVESAQRSLINQLKHRLSTTKIRRNSISKTNSTSSLNLNSKSTISKDEFLAEGESSFANFVDEIENVRRMAAKQKSDERRLGKYIVFAVTTLTSIGYGNDAPKSNGGRWFCIVYCLVGLPLMMIALADMAKFLSELVLWFYLKYRKMKNLCKILVTRCVARVFCRDSEDLTLHEHICIDLNFWGDEEVAEFLWRNLETAEFVEVPAMLAFLIILTYAGFGALFFWLAEGWTPFDAFYFSVISVLSIGFGDLVPSNPRFLFFSILYLTCGMIITTMCVDAAAYRYIQKIYLFQRHFEKTDDLHWLRSIQEIRMRKDAIRTLFTTFAFLPMLNVTGRIRQEHDDDGQPRGRLESLHQVLSHDNSMSVPVITKFVVTNVTAHTVNLSWSCDARPADFIEYVLQYGPRHNSGPMCATVEIRHIWQTEHIIKGLKSFTLYEFVLQASNVKGKSSSQALLQYTEPETVPQNVSLLPRADGTSVTLNWECPFRNKSLDRRYHVYYCDDTNVPFELWSRLYVQNARTIVIEKLMPETVYYFCVSAIHNTGAAVLSRIVSINISLSLKEQQHEEENEDTFQLNYRHQHMWRNPTVKNRAKIRRGTEMPGAFERMELRSRGSLTYL